LKIQGVPSVFADGKLLHVGRGEFSELLAKLEEQYGIDDTKAMNEVKEYDVIVKLGEQKVETIKQYHEQLGKHSAGEVVTVTAMRKGAEG
jgi:alkyl hydroperoxide reductase subunit AhpF